MEASARDRREVVRQLLAAEGINLNLQDITGRSALMEASQRGFFEIVRRLLEQKADVNLQGTLSGRVSHPSNFRLQPRLPPSLSKRLLHRISSSVRLSLSNTNSLVTQSQ